MPKREPKTIYPDDELHDWISQQARRNERSWNKEVIWLLKTIREQGSKLSQPEFHDPRIGPACR